MFALPKSRGYLNSALIIFVLIASVGPLNSFAFESRLNEFKTQYPAWPNTATDGTHGCATCHNTNTGSGGANAYRLSFANNSNSFTAIENLDSDGDGVTNINEIKLGFHPAWKAGDAGLAGLGVNISSFLTPQNDLSLNMTAPNQVTVGANITYTLTVANAGPQDATAVEVTNTLPANVTFVSSTPSQGSCSRMGVTVSCNLDLINNGNSATVSIIVTTTAVGSQVNNGSVEAGQIEISAGNNMASASTNVIAVPPPPPPPPPPSGSASGVLPAIISLLLADPDGLLRSGVPVSRSIEQGVFEQYSINVPPGTGNVLVELTNLSADIDLFVREGAPPIRAIGGFDCISEAFGTTDETCNIMITTTPTRIFIGVYGFDPGTNNYTLTATLQAPP
jgi:uncharacterized repeat protein (TIGR01451 family)